MKTVYTQEEEERNHGIFLPNYCRKIESLKVNRSVFIFINLMETFYGSAVILFAQCASIYYLQETTVWAKKKKSVSEEKKKK